MIGAFSAFTVGFVHHEDVSDLQQTGLHGLDTVAEAGRKGGQKVRDERGHEFYEEIGRKGGQKVRALIEAGKRAGTRPK